MKATSIAAMPIHPSYSGKYWMNCTVVELENHLLIRGLNDGRKHFKYTMSAMITLYDNGFYTEGTIDPDLLRKVGSWFNLCGKKLELERCAADMNVLEGYSSKENEVWPIIVRMAKKYCETHNLSQPHAPPLPQTPVRPQIAPWSNRSRPQILPQVQTPPQNQKYAQAQALVQIQSESPTEIPRPIATNRRIFLLNRKESSSQTRGSQPIQSHQSQRKYFVRQISENGNSSSAQKNGEEYVYNPPLTQHNTMSGQQGALTADYNPEYRENRIQRYREARSLNIKTSIHSEVSFPHKPKYSRPPQSKNQQRNDQIVDEVLGTSHRLHPHFRCEQSVIDSVTNAPTGHMLQNNQNSESSGQHLNNKPKIGDGRSSMVRYRPNSKLQQRVYEPSQSLSLPSSSSSSSSHTWINLLAKIFWNMVVASLVLVIMVFLIFLWISNESSTSAEVSFISSIDTKSIKEFIATKRQDLTILSDQDIITRVSQMTATTHGLLSSIHDRLLFLIYRLLL